MKKWLILIGIIALIFIGGYFILSFYAVKFIRAKLQEVVGPGFTIAEINLQPTCLSAKGVRYEDPLSKRRFFQIEEVRLYPDLTSFLKGTLRIRECMILRPAFFFYRSREGNFIGPWAAAGKKEKSQEKSQEISEDTEKKEKEPIHIKIDRFQIRKGSVHFDDRKVGEPPAQIQLRELDLELKNVQYPLISSHSPIELKGKIKGKKGEGNIYTKGWIDPKTMDMEASFKVGGIEIRVFEPYYRKRVSAEIDSGSIDMEAKIVLRNKIIDAPGKLELVDLHIKEGGTIFWIPAKILIGLLKDKRNRIPIQFHVKGNMDDPKFSLQETFLTRVAVSLAETLGVPIKIVGEKGFGGAGKGLGGIVESLKSIGELFQKKKEKGR